MNSRIFIRIMKTGTVPQQITLLTKYETEKMIKAVGDFGV
jgi:hypothetical protein